MAADPQIIEMSKTITKMMAFYLGIAAIIGMTLGLIIKYFFK